MTDSLLLLKMARDSAFPQVRALSDSSEINNLTTSLNAVTKAWPIAAYDAQPGVLYRMTAAGTGQQGTSQQALTIQLFAFNVAFCATVAASGDITANDVFHWRFQAELLITAAGVSGTARSCGTFTWSTAVSSTTAARSLAAGTTGADATIDTIVSANMAVQAGWASVTGAPLITGLYSLFERIGA